MPHVTYLWAISKNSFLTSYQWLPPKLRDWVVLLRHLLRKQVQKRSWLAYVSLLLRWNELLGFWRASMGHSVTARVPRVYYNNWIGSVPQWPPIVLQENKTQMGPKRQEKWKNNEMPFYYFCSILLHPLRKLYLHGLGCRFCQKKIKNKK